MKRLFATFALTVAVVTTATSDTKAQGTLGWGAGPVGGVSTITVSNGTYGAQSGWNPQKVLLLAIRPGDSVVYNNAPGSTISNGQWSAVINNAPPGTYTV